ncbi:MAG: putative manganese transporter [Chlamydiota bacterium]
MLETLQETLMITGFVFVMMLLIEYINVLTKGHWRSWLSNNKWQQYLLATLLGILPGCLGAFAVVSMYNHCLLSLGAVVATMIATTGDGAFLMFALIPKTTLFINIALFIIAILSGWAIDKISRRWKVLPAPSCDVMAIHREERCRIFPSSQQFWEQWRSCNLARIFLTLIIIALTGSLILGYIGPQSWNYLKITLLAIYLLALFMVATVPTHFLKEHLWHHVTLKHLPRMFLWILGSLTALHFLQENLEITNLINHNLWIVLLLACIIGIIPESGPHLIFITLYAKGIVPFSILFASSIVQDGHGMLPLLADSRKSFIFVKGVNFIIGLTLGALLLIFKL